MVFISKSPEMQLSILISNPDAVETMGYLCHEDMMWQMECECHVLTSLEIEPVSIGPNERRANFGIWRW